MGLSLMRRLVTVFHNQPEVVFTVKVLKKQIEDEDVHDKNYPRNTYYVYLRRLSKFGIVEPVTNDVDPDEPAFKCASVFKAKSYLEGHYQDYTPGMTPTNPPIRPADSVRHRPAYKLQLSNSELEVVRGVGKWERSGRQPGYWRINHKDFSLRAWTSGKARIFLKDDWREGLSRVLGLEFVKQVESEVADRNGHVGWARHPPANAGKLPTGQILRVVNPEGKVTTFQYGYSQIPSGELDRHGPENDPYADMVEKWLFDDGKCKVDLANRIASLDRTLNNLPDLIGKAVASEVKKAIESLNKPSPEPEYKAPKADQEDYTGYG